MYVLVSHKWSNLLYNNFEVLRAEGVLCDVTLHGNDGKTQLAHSTVLAAASPVLRSCLVQAPRGHYVVKIPSISSTLWDLLVSFIYKGRVRVSPTLQQELANAAHTLGLSELQGLLVACCGSALSMDAQISESIAAATGDSSKLPIEDADHELITVMDDFKTEDITEGDVIKENEHGKFVQRKLETGKNTKYTCTLCGKSFPWGKSLHVHELMHKQKKSLKHTCGKCNKTFGSYHSLRAHERSHSYQPYKCEQCDVGFHFRVNYDLHLKKAHNVESENEYRCSQCDKVFDAKGLLDRHMTQVHHKIKKDKNKESPPKVNRKSVNSSEIVRCGKCDVLFVTRDLLNNHYLIDHDVRKPYPCEMCEYVYESQERLDEHQKIHLGKNQKLNSPVDVSGLVEDDSSQDEDKSSTFKCKVCGLACKSQRLLLKHTRTHEGQVSDSLWRCPMCAAEFDNRPDFGMHVAEHRGERTYTCKYCNKGFTHKGNYTTHMQRHLGIKPYSCQFCTKTFVRKDDMKSHMRVHTGEKPFNCQVCHMKFGCISNLREHERAKHNVSFSKRNPNITVPRQHRPKVKYRSKNVAQIDLTGSDFGELTNVVQGSFAKVVTMQSTTPASLDLENKASASHLESKSDTSASQDSSEMQHVILTDTDGQPLTITGQDAQEQYFQVIQSEDGIQTLTPVFHFDQEGNQMSLTIESAEQSKVEDSHVVETCTVKEEAS